MKARPKISKGHQYFLIAFVAIFMVPAGIGFGCKLFEFFSVVSLPADGRFEDGRFALIPLLNYLLVFGGMLCFLMWGDRARHVSRRGRAQVHHAGERRAS
jgi:hypothetical protein